LSAAKDLKQLSVLGVIGALRACRGDFGVDTWMRFFVAALLRMTATTTAKANGPAEAGRYRRKYFLEGEASPGRFSGWRHGGGRAAALQRFLTSRWEWGMEGRG
jgi:hypothetical protein